MMRTSATDHLWSTTEENRQGLIRGYVHAIERLNQDGGIPTFRFRDQRVKIPVKEAADLIDVQHSHGPVFRVFFAGALVMDVDLSESWRQWGRELCAFKVSVMRHYGYGIHGILKRAYPAGQYAPACLRSHRSQHFAHPRSEWRVRNVLRSQLSDRERASEWRAPSPD